MHSNPSNYGAEGIGTLPSLVAPRDISSAFRRKMNSLRAVEAGLPPGFRFHPRDDELICDYLMKRVAGCTPSLTPFLLQVDLNSCEPWDIPEAACVGGKAWYFYSQRDKKYANGLRTNRATLSGYWKATGKDRPVTHKGLLVGMRKTLVFYQGRAPKGTKTDWVMHEFRLQWKFGPPVSYVQECTGEDWVLCRVFRKNTTPYPPKQHMESGFSTNSSSPPMSLPPSMEPLDPLIRANYHQEQVPCFSFVHTSNPCRSPLQTQLDQQILVSLTDVKPSSAGLTPDLGGILCQNSDPSRHEKVKLGHFTKMESSDKDSCVEGGSWFGDQEFAQSYLPRSELDSVWN